MPRKIFVTSALPNANGPIHLGHMLEHIQTDIWVRFQRMRGHEVIYACADDTHGTATMLKAEEEDTTPEELIERVRVELNETSRTSWSAMTTITQHIHKKTNTTQS